MVSGRWAAISLLICLGFTALHAAEAARLKVLTSLPALYSWTKSVAGEAASVENLLPADVGPHNFQFRPRDLKRVQEADLILINGLGIETWLERAFQNNADHRTNRVVRVMEGVSAELIYHLPELELEPGPAHTSTHHHEHAAAGELPNPHLWLDPIYARQAVSNISAVLSQRDPIHRANYEKNAAAYDGQLVALDAEFRKLSDGLKHKSIVTYHDSFPYFARRYGFELVGVVEEIPSVAPSPKYISTLSAVIRKHAVQVIFTEPQFEPRLVRQLTRDLGITFAELDVLETGPIQADFYVQGMRRNLRTLAEALK